MISVSRSISAICGFRSAEFSGEVGAPFFKTSFKGIEVIILCARPFAEFRNRNAVERDSVDHVLNRIVLEPGQQNLAFDARAALVGHLVQTLENCGNDRGFSCAGWPLDERDVGRIQRDLNRLFLHDGRRISEDFFAHKCRERLDFLRRTGGCDLPFSSIKSPSWGLAARPSRIVCREAIRRLI